MTDAVLILGVCLIAAFFHVRGGPTTMARLTRATFWSLLIGLVIAGMF